MGANKPHPIVPLRRMRPYMARSSPSMVMVALSAREEIGERNVLNKMIAPKTTAKLVRDGNRNMTKTATMIPKLITHLCHRFESAMPVQEGAAIRVTTAEYQSVNQF